MSSIEYQVTYTPASATPNLITLSTTTVESIEFAQSTDITDAKEYTVTVKARKVGSANWINPAGTATATYTYYDLCKTTTLLFPTTNTNSMTTSVLIQTQTSSGSSPYYVYGRVEATHSVSLEH